MAENESGEATTQLPRLPLPEPPMDRAALLAAVAKVASAAALGQPNEAGQRGLDGKPFELRIRFGCASGGTQKTASPAGPFNVRFDEETRTLKVRAAPDLSLDDARIAARAGEAIETVEGFWMYRPWLLTAGCPVAAQRAQAAEEDAPPAATKMEKPTSALSLKAPVQELAMISPATASFRVGIAQYFSESDSRTRRRDQRAYEATKLLEEGQVPSRDGYDLVLAGRLRKLPDGSVISCVVESVDAPPECVVSAAFDRVTIEQPATGEILAQWGG